MEEEQKPIPAVDQEKTNKEFVLHCKNEVARIEKLIQELRLKSDAIFNIMCDFERIKKI